MGRLINPNRYLTTLISYEGGKLKSWRILQADIPCFVVYTSFCNMYASIDKIERALDAIKKSLEQSNRVLQS